MAILVFAGVLSVPSAVFAEASWYGSIRGGVEFSEGGTNYYDGASRWGIRGSSEASEGLTAVYRFESKLSTSNASQPGGRLAFVGLTGGFGTFTLGQILSASYNHAGVIRDIGNWVSSPDTSVRVGNALSYAVSNDAFSMQFDAISTGGKDTGKTVDQLEFGMTVNMGDFGRVALSHTSVYDTIEPVSYWADYTGTTADTRTDFEVKKIMVEISKADTTNLANGELNATGLGAIARVGDKYSIGSCGAAADGSDACIMVEAFEETRTTYTNSAGTNTPATTQVFYANGVNDYDVVSARNVDEVGYKANHLSVEFGLGALTAALGYSESKKNGASASTKTTYIGATGGIGDTGMDWRAFSRVVSAPDGSKTKPWGIGLGKSLGGGAWTYLEHHNDGANTSYSVVGLGVSF